MRAMDQIQVKTHQIYLRISPGPRGAIRGDDLGKLWEDFFSYGAREYQMVADWTTEIRAAILKGERPAPVTIEAFLKRTGFEVFYNEDGYVSRVRWTYPSGVTQTRTASKIRRGLEAAFLEDAPRGTLPRDAFRRPWFERVEVPRQAAEAVQGTVERRGSLELRAIRDKWKRGETLTQAEVQKIFDLARDPVTGLRNRAWWEMAVFQTSDDLPVKAVIDLNYLKYFNDSGGAGHANGDKLLKALAEAIQQVAPGESQAMRVGGDEFLLLFPDQATADTALARLRELTSDVPFKWDEVVQGIPTGQRVNVRGIHFEVGTGATFDEADQAMQLAKEARPPTRGQPPPGLTHPPPPPPGAPPRGAGRRAGPPADGQRHWRWCAHPRRLVEQGQDRFPHDGRRPGGGPGGGGRGGGHLENSARHRLVRDHAGPGQERAHGGRDPRHGPPGDPHAKRHRLPNR